MGFVEGIGGEAAHVVVDLVGSLLRNAVVDAARAFVAGIGAAMDKMVALGLHDLVLLFAHGAAHQIRLTVAESPPVPGRSA